MLRLGARLGVLALLRLILLRLIAGISGAAGHQEGRQYPGHLAGGGVVLAQEARQRGGRHGFQETARALMAGVTGARENLGRALAGIEIFRPHRDRRETANQKHHRR
jgi:hypothetical protein